MAAKAKARGTGRTATKSGKTAAGRSAKPKGKNRG